MVRNQLLIIVVDFVDGFCEHKRHLDQNWDEPDVYLPSFRNMTQKAKPKVSGPPRPRNSLPTENFITPDSQPREGISYHWCGRIDYSLPNEPLMQT